MNISKTIRLDPGHYVVAVSGGVDSMALLDLLAQIGHRAKGKEQSKTEQPLSFTIAHFDHGIRPNSKADRLLVEKIARGHGLPFVYSEGNLGAGTSEDVARKARYEFLRKVQKDTNADGIITAHHFDDVLETAIHNILRGTGRKGMSSLKSVDGIVRPLLHLPKQHLVDYAKANNLEWNEDFTNQDTNYRRNYIRHRILPKVKQLSPEKFEQLKRITRRQAELNHAIDNHLRTILHLQPSTTVLKRLSVAMLPHAVARELVGEWLRANGKREFDRKLLEKVTMAIKTAQPNTTLVLDKNFKIEFSKKLAKISVSQ